MEVHVIRSARRRKTAQARMVDGVLEVRVPAHVSRTEEAELVAHFRERIVRARRADAVDLTRRAATLASRFDLPTPASIRWVSNQRHRWGSCSPHSGEVRLSDRMIGFPPWVIDHVIVHELAHLVEEGHGPAFRALVARNPLAERAEGYLLAKSGETDPSVDPLASDAEPLSEGDG